MSDPAASVASPASANPPAKASFWEDLIDIFYQPSAVYARRANASPWPPLLFVSIAIAIITYLTFNAIQPALDAQYTRMLPQIMHANPAMTQDMAEKGRAVQNMAVRYGVIVIIPFSILIVGLCTWLLGKLFDGREGFSGAMVIASYAYMPRVLGAVISGAIALLVDPAKLTSMAALSLSPARFLNPDTASPVTTAVLSRLDLMILWETVLLSIGLSVIGRVSRNKAIVFGIIIWVLGGLYQLRAAYMMS